MLRTVIMSDLYTTIAYIDPMSGSLVVQFIVAAVVGGAVWFRNQIIGAFTWLKQKTIAKKV